MWYGFNWGKPTCGYWEKGTSSCQIIVKKKGEKEKNAGETLKRQRKWFKVVEEGVVNLVDFSVILVCSFLQLSKLFW